MILATSVPQRQAVDDGAVPPPEQIGADVWAVPMPMPGAQMNLRYTLTYLLRGTDGLIHVVDPGWDSDENAAQLTAAVDRLGGRVGSIIVTHLHPDHLAMAPRLRDQSGAPIVMHERELTALEQLLEDEPVNPTDWGVPPDRVPELTALAQSRSAYRPLEPDVLVRGSVDHIRLSDLDLEVLHTPGHTTGHICLRLPRERLLLTGDHVLPASYPGLGLGGRSITNPIADYLESLELLTAFADHEVLPGHQYRFTGLANRIATITAHHRRRTAEVHAVLETDPLASVYDTAAALTWSRGWDGMRGFLLYSALAQTAMHVDLIRRAALTDTH